MRVLTGLVKTFGVLLLLLLTSCAKLPQSPNWEESLVYVVAENENLLQQHAPVFVVEEAARKYNRIGTPVASLLESKEVVRVDPEKATLYTAKRIFTTERSTYTNLYYRIHFTGVPISLVPFYLGAGDNVGLLVIITLDSSKKPILYTVVHTCGCYLAFIPTSYLPRESYPPGWESGRQAVFGENLPGFLQFSTSGQEKLVMHLRGGTHRVKNIWLAADEELRGYMAVSLELQSFEALERLRLANGSSTSFFETSGTRKGYVKGSHKIWERLLVGWWALDWRVGEDKKLGADTSDGIIFYTSLKPWARKESDLRDVVGFLRYWGWKL